MNYIYSDFRDCKDFVSKNQVASAGISVMNNISEGFGRNSGAEFRQFLNIAKGSVTEVKNMYYITEDLKYSIAEIASDRRALCQRIVK